MTVLRALLGICIAVWTPFAAASVTASVDREEIFVSDLVQFVIRVAGANVEDPDLTPLAVDFEVVNTNTSNQFTSINGKVESSSSWVMRLRPKRDGILMIPAITVGAERTSPIEIRVRPVPENIRAALAAAAFFETALSAPEVYVQAELEVTRRLFYADRAQLFSEMPQAPQIEDAIVVQIGETATYSEAREADSYSVIEQRYAVFPERSGQLVVPRVAVSATVRLPGERRRRPYRVESEPVAVTIKPVPDSYPANRPWLPARRVELSETWEPVAGIADVGGTLRRTLVVTARGTIGSAIPPLAVAAPDTFKVYPDPPEYGDRQRRGALYGHRRETFSMIPTAGGKTVVPGVALTWWDIDTDNLRVTEIDATHFEVEGSAPAGMLASGDQATPPGGTAEPSEPVFNQTLGWLLALSGWLAVPLTWLLARHRTVRRSLRSSPATPRPPRPAGLHSLRRKLMRAEPGQQKPLVLEWLGLHWQLAPARVVLVLRTTATGRDLLELLNGRRYAATPGQADLDVPPILGLAGKLVEPAANTPDGLPPLYPDSSATRA